MTWALLLLFLSSFAFALLEPGIQYQAQNVTGFTKRGVSKSNYFLEEAIKKTITGKGEVKYFSMISVDGSPPQRSWTTCQRWRLGLPPWTTGHVVARYKLEDTELPNVKDRMINGVMFAVITDDYVFHGVIPNQYWQKAYKTDGRFGEAGMKSTLDFFVQSDGSQTDSSSSSHSTLAWCQSQVRNGLTVHGVVFLYPSLFPSVFIDDDPTPFISSLKMAFRKQLALSEGEFDDVFRVSTYKPWTQKLRWEADHDFETSDEEDSDEEDSDDEETKRKISAILKAQEEEDDREVEYAALHFVPGDAPHVDLYHGNISSLDPAVFEIPLSLPCA